MIRRRSTPNALPGLRRLQPRLSAPPRAAAARSSAAMLLTAHNLRYYADLMAAMRDGDRSGVAFRFRRRFRRGSDRAALGGPRLSDRPADPARATARRCRNRRTRRCSRPCPTRIPGSLYLVRFTCPEFTSLCPVTGQPDFAHLVIDYVPQGGDRREQVVEALSRRPFATTAPFTRTARWRSPAGWSRHSRRNGCGSAATGIREAAFRSTSSIRPASRPPGCGCPIRVSRPIAAAAERMTDPIREAIREQALAMGFDAVGFAAARLGAEARAGLAEFIARGYHGDMGWLAGTAARRGDPQHPVARGADRHRARRQLRARKTTRWPRTTDRSAARSRSTPAAAIITTR